MLILVLLIPIMVFSPRSCREIIEGESYYTFTGDRLGEFLQENDSLFSLFVELLQESEVIGLLNAYGDYTCFAPTNEAVEAFYESKGVTGIGDLDPDEVSKIVKDHIISGYTITSEDFIEGRIAQMSMSNRYISTSFAKYKAGEAIITLNDTLTEIIMKDIEVHNGVIHAINRVIIPTDKSLVEAISSDERFTLFTEALLLTELDEKLQLVEDLTYNKNDYSYPSVGTVRFGITLVLPEYRKYGYTALIESDSIYKENGINNLDDLRDYAKSVYDVVYPEDAGVSDETDPRNSLNRFIAYHLMDKELGFTKFIIAYDDYDYVYATNKLYDSYEYIATLCPNTLIEVRTWRDEGKTNIFNFINETDYIELEPGNTDNDAINGVYHEITGILTYNFDVASELSSKRLRMNIASFFPEITNNNMRGRGINNTTRVILPTGYVEGIWCSDETELQYYSADTRLGTYQSDEFGSTAAGLYDIEITTLPIPAGTYEVRLSYQPNGNRGAAQLYFDGEPTGIPLDINITAGDPAIGYVLPGTDPTDPYGYENDKMMRNRGYMKGPASFRLGSWYPAESARLSESYLRKILGIFYFEEAGPHTLRIKASRQGQLQMDFMEFVPTEIIEKEGID